MTHVLVAGIAKVLFISLYYALLTPFSLFLAFLAYILIFCIHRFLLLRRWQQQPLLNEKIALLLRQEALLGVAAHMYITTRFIYSWPMDQGYFDGSNWEKVDKYPTYAIWTLSTQKWHTQGQRDIFTAYQVCALLVGLCTVFIWIVYPLLQRLHRLFFKRYKPRLPSLALNLGLTASL